MLWREVITELSEEYPDVILSHMLVDNAAMQLVREPKQFDVIVTGNLFGDILSDIAAMMTGSIGMLPSASLNSENKGMYEPVHGSAPDIAGKGVANPLATILSAAMMLRYSFGLDKPATQIEMAIDKTLEQGFRTYDLEGSEEQKLGTREIGQIVIDNLQNLTCLGNVLQERRSARVVACANIPTPAPTDTRVRSFSERTALVAKCCNPPLDMAPVIALVNSMSKYSLNS